MATPVQPPPPPAQPTRPPPEREWWPWFLLLLVVVVAGLLVWLFAIHGNHKKTTVPKVVGMQSQAAVQLLQRRHLEDVPFTAPNTRPKGVVFAQIPGAGARVNRGHTVQISISSGPARKAVPNVTGLAEAQASQQLMSSGFTPKVKRVASSHPKGIVVDQEPVAGVTAVKGTTVVISVSNGLKPVVVPSVVGETQGTAVTQLTKLGLETKLQNVPSTKPAGQVVAQKPHAGKEVDKGSTVVLNISTGTGGGTTTVQQTTTTSTTVTTTASARTVPNVRGFRQTPAERRLSAAGFRPTVRYVQSTRPAGRVVTESPAPGTKLRRGSRVRLGVSSGPSPNPVQTVPDVIGDDQASAVSTLRRAGFQVLIIDEQTTDQTEDGLVIDEQPGSGSRIPRGSQVTIFVGRFSSG
jgi:beta-lactam-binding protein with PASTA domain